MVKKPSSQQNTIKRFISLERAILGWDMISAGFGLSQTISGREDSVIVSTTQKKYTLQDKKRDDNALGTGKSGLEFTGIKPCTKN